MTNVNKKYIIIMAVLLSGLVSGFGYKKISDGRKPQISAAVADIYAAEGILHLKMEQHGGSEYDNFVLVIQINKEKYNGEVIVDGTAQKIKNGKLKLKGGQKAEIGSIPFGSEYHVSEKENISYITKADGEEIREVSGVIDQDHEEPAVTFSNIWGSGSLGIRVVNKGGSSGRFFEFSVKINGEPYDDDVRLKGNETAEFDNIPFGSEYEIIMQEASGYTTVVDELETCVDTGIISGQNRSPVVVFENTCDKNICGKDTSAEACPEKEKPVMNMEMNASGNTDGNTERNTDGNTERNTDGNTGRNADKNTERNTDKNTEKNTIVKLTDTGFAGIVIMQVRDQNGDPVEDARYQLFAEVPPKGNISECWQAYEEDEENGIYTTNLAGVLMVSDLPANNYYFAELKGTEGYELSGSRYIFTVEKRE